MDNKMLFSQAALDKLRTPERLDKMLPITTPVNWVAGAVIGVLLCSVLVWSIFGSFTESVDGMGLIMDSNGVVNVSHVVGGKVNAVHVKTGSHVHKGDLVASLEKASEEADARMAKDSMGLASSERDAVHSAYEYATKKYQKEVTQKVHSKYDGIVDEVMVDVGSIVASGSPICSIRLDQGTDELSGIFYIPVKSGKRVQPGMTIQLAPNGVDTTETGSLIGVVRSVSQYPISGQGVRLGVGNQELAQYIMKQKDTALMEVRFDLVRDASSDDRYLWTSIVGEHPTITPGSFCTGSIVVERKPPIEKVFYKISQWLRDG